MYMNLLSAPNLFGSTTGAVAGCGACSGGGYKKKSKRKTKRGVKKEVCKFKAINIAKK